MGKRNEQKVKVNNCTIKVGRDQFSELKGVVCVLYIYFIYVLEKRILKKAK